MDNFEVVAAQSGELSATHAAASAKAEIEAGYLMAIRRPRNLDDVRTRILAAVSRPVFAETAEYSKPVGKTNIKGPSIRFAEVALQAAGNIRTSAVTVFEDERLRKVRVTVTDLETNISFGKEITLSKTVERSYVKDGQQCVGQRENSQGKITYIVIASEDELANKQAAAESKILRNEGLRLIPKDIIEEAMQVAREVRAKNAGDPKAAVNKILDCFAGLGIKPSELEKYLGKPMAQLLPDDIEKLRGIFTSIRDGEARWSDYLDDAKPVEDPNEKLRAATAAKQEQAAPKKDPFANINPKHLAQARGQLNISAPVEKLTADQIDKLIAVASEIGGDF